MAAIRLRSGPVTVPTGCGGPIKEGAVMRVEESIIIDRPAEEVFGFLLVRTNDPVWLASVTESEWLDPAAPMRVGAADAWSCKPWGGVSSWTR